jgi:hypothetical protein
LDTLFEKTVFLSDIFKEINEEDLLILSEEIRFKKDISSGLKTFIDGAIIWPLSADKQHDRVYIYYDEDSTDNKRITDIPADTPCYILPLKSVEEFKDHFPEKSFEILKYIDDNEI